jgi:hypothetical protein
MENPISNIVSVFEYFSTEINDEKTNFRNAEVWENLNLSLKRIYRIDLLTEIENNLNQKRPQQFQIEEKTSSFCNVYSTNHYVKDVIKVEFERFYPNIICRLHEEGIIDVGISYEPYYYLIKNEKSIKPFLSKDGTMCMNLYINYFYGLKLTSKQKRIVAGRGYIITEHFSKYNGWLYSDTDVFFIKDKLDLDKKLKSDLDILELPYTITYLKEMLIIERKRYVEIKNDGIGKIYGYKNR